MNIIGYISNNGIIFDFKKRSYSRADGSGTYSHKLLVIGKHINQHLFKYRYQGDFL